ncbi:MAG TPA: nicotinate-nucleotide--dimethylbenzimidazole phosphoribosyltransferase [Syntrophaceae bacterium]|nr:nicotinate-nucleotide--dimethylbenzimidazole phosphoribosyltransferase [Syntrophaceae bacterium]
MSKLKDVLGRIQPINMEYYFKAQERLDNLTKPKGSLGRLEEFAKRYVAIRGNLRPRIEKKAILVFVGDHGVTEEGVSAYPKEVTHQMVLNFLDGGAGINVIARHVGCEVKVVDIGVDYNFEPTWGLISKKVAYGTKNITLGPAMQREQALQALDVGIEIVQQCVSEKIDIIGTGDMGIGNTTASSAITAVITGRPVEEVTGRGTGIDDETYLRKIEAIKKAIEINRPDPSDPIDVLSKVGGLEIAGIAGSIVGAAANRIPVVIDGFISGTGALIATQLDSRIRDYIFAAHRSQEIGHGILLEKIGLVPFLDLSMRLGEGTGAALGINFIEVGLKIYNEMATFSEAMVSEAHSK